MLNRKLFIKYVSVNIPVAIFLLYTFLSMFYAATDIKPSAGIVAVTQLLLLLYSFFVIFLFISYFVKPVSLLSKLNKHLENEKIKLIFIKIDSWIPGGIKLVISGLVINLFWQLLNNTQYYYEMKIINNLNVLGSKISGLEQKIVFEVISVSGFDFISFNHIVFYIFEMLRDYSWIILILNVCLLFWKISTKFKLLIFLNGSFFIYLVAINPYIESNYFLLDSIKNSNNHQATVKYPLLTKILKQDTFQVEIHDLKTKLEKLKRGRVSSYPEEDINIIHSDNLFCSLRNYNFSKSNRAPIQLFDQDAGFENINEYLTVDIQSKGFLENIYDLEITNKYDNIKINNTYLEYDGDSLYFKKINSENSKKDTGVSIKCKDYVYSLYYDKNKVAVEKFDTLLTTGVDELFRNPFDPDEYSYSYRGTNINELNPYKCDQLKRLNVNMNNVTFGSKDFEKMIINSICINSIPFYDKENENDYKKIEYNNKKQ